MKKNQQYFWMPEMRIFWVFLFSALFILGTNIIFLKDFYWTAINGLILFFIGFLIFSNNLKTAKLNLTLLAGKNRLSSIVSSIGDGIIVYDNDFKIIIFNKAAEEIFNIKKADIIGRIISPNDVKLNELKVLTQVVFPSLAPAVVRRSNETIYPQISDISFDNPRLELRVITNRLGDEKGQLFGFLKVVRDRTREVELLETKNDFVAVAAHQLRTPLTAVSWALEALNQEPLTDSQKDLVKTGLGASSNLLKIIEDLLNVAKIEEGKFGYDFENIDLIKFLQTVLSQTQPIAREYKVNLFFEPTPESSLTIFADPRKLGVVFSNLLNNAIRYNVANGQVIVSVKRLTDKPYVQISVADTGIGIPQNEIKNLFSKFFRASNVKTVEPSGSGLGLYLVKNIVRRHGGNIWVESTLGRGTAFYFTLPTDSNLIPSKEVVYGE